ncbi:hypothetical protein BDW62DRAFT_206256 [Aspergillus aurantiobrunneus]
MDRDKTARVLDGCVSEITRLFLIEGWTYKRIRQLLVSRGAKETISLDQLKRLLKERGIYKNLSNDEVLVVKKSTGPATPTWGYLVFANNVLLKNARIDSHYKKNKLEKSLRKPEAQDLRRILTIMPLNFEFRALKQPERFRSFQRVLFYTQTYFEFSFDHGVWAPDSRGLYARTETLRSDLSALSNMHNMVFDALRQLQAGKEERCRSLLRNTFRLHQSVVMNHHHRQLSDIIAILLLIHRATTLGDMLAWITTSLVAIAQQKLPQNDPRRIMFESLPSLPLDSDGHLYLAFDAYCRYLWKTKTGPESAKACYSYNQASFPRADPGSFYDFFARKGLERTQLILKKVDKELEEYSHETFMLWHTAVRCLKIEQRYYEMELLVRQLCTRVWRLGNLYDYHHARQLNYDSMLTFFLLGDALQAQGQLSSAVMAFAISVEIRCRIVPINAWDGGKSASLRRLEDIATRVQDMSIAGDYIDMKEFMYSSL